MIQAIIFDMDGLLIDSEPIWQEAEKEVFLKVWVVLNDQQVTYTTGLRVDEVVEYWFVRFPWNEAQTLTKQQIVIDIVDTVKKLIREKWEAKKWATKILEMLYNKWLPMSIASSSDYSIIDTVVEKLEIKKYFTLIYSAQEEKYWKPHPGVYLSACKKMNVTPENTITFEDSFNGVLSAKSAKIKCIAIPEDINRNNPKFVISDMILESLEDFNEPQWEELDK